MGVFPTRHGASRRALLARLASWLSVWLLPLALLGCLKKDYPPDRLVIEEVEFENARSIDADELEERLASVESPRFLGIWDGVVFDYEVYDKNTLARDLERVERYYRRRGYYEAKVTAGRVVQKKGSRHVRIQIRVKEGEPVLVQDVRTPGIEHLPAEAAFAAVRASLLVPNRPFDEDVYEQSKKAIARELANRGYAFVRIKGSATVDVLNHRALVEFKVDPGPQAQYGKVAIVGLKEIPVGPVRDNLSIREGEPYSNAELEDAEKALVNLGVFSNVEIKQDLTQRKSRRVPITVVVKESSLRGVKLGGGTQFDQVRLTAHLRAGWEDRNFLGGMRRFTIDTRPGVTFFPTRIPFGSQAKEASEFPPTAYFPENYLHTELRQPSFIEGRTTGFVSGDYNLYPLLYATLGRDDRVIGYHEIKARAGLERAFFNHHLSLIPSYNWQANFPFLYQQSNPGPGPGEPELPEGLDIVRVSYPELLAILDFRDDRAEPRRGVFLSSSFQVAGYIFQGTVDDFRISPEVRAYAPLSKAVTLATRVTTGFLFPGNYGQDGEFELGRNPTDPSVIKAQHQLLFRAFYSGGANSNRGYPYQGVGPQGPLGFLVPTGLNCDPSIPLDQLSARCIRPLGGLTLWEASLEARIKVSDNFRLATFIDSSNVTRQEVSFDFQAPHISVGPGFRYLTPVGPVRFDVGYRIPGLQRVGEDQLSLETGNAGNFFDVEWLPIAIHIAIGEAF